MEPKGYTDQTAVENYLLIDVDEVFVDQVKEWIRVVEAYIDNYTDRDFSPQGETPTLEDRTFDGSGDDTLFIDPATDVTEVRFSEDGDPLSADQYVLYPSGTSKTKIKLRYLKFPKGLQNIYVNAKWGYDAVPADIKFAATVLLAGIINTQWESGDEIASMTIGRYSVTYKTKSQVSDFEQVEDILKFHKRYTF